MTLRSISRRCVYHSLRLSGLLSARRRVAERRGKGWASVIVFHRVVERGAEDGITIALSRFRKVSRMLQARYNVISATDMLDRIRVGRGLTGREVVITFDDGYADNFELAAPVLADLSLPAVFFLTAGYVGTDKPFPWDSAKPIRPRTMTWANARSLASAGFELGSHTWSHPDLGVTPVDQSPTELLKSRMLIEEMTGTRVRHFAYPFGGRANITQDWAKAVERAGYSSLFCGFGGSVLTSTSPFWLPRIGGSHQRSLADLRIDIDRPW